MEKVVQVQERVGDKSLRELKQSSAYKQYLSRGVTFENDSVKDDDPR